MFTTALILGILEVIGFLLLTIFIYKLADVLFKQSRRGGIIIIRLVSIFLLIDGISRPFHIHLL